MSDFSINTTIGSAPVGAVTVHPPQAGVAARSIPVGGALPLSAPLAAVSVCSVPTASVSFLAPFASAVQESVPSANVVVVTFFPTLRVNGLFLRLSDGGKLRILS